VVPTGSGGWYPRSFVLTDIVDSVSQWERDAELMADAVARHDAIIGREVATAKGELVRSKGEGDSTFSVFAHPAEAVAAAVAIQAAVGAEQWPAALPMRVRAGVHTGDAEPRDGDWYGPAVNRAARLRALANGGQTLVSGVTAGLMADQLPAGVRLLYRGRRVLRGIERPEEVWELVAADDPRLAAATSTGVAGLPAALTRFVGRSADFDQLSRLLEDERLVTLTGPGGGGKSRLAMELATHAAHRGEAVWLAELAPLQDGALVAQAVASAVGIEIGPNPLDDLLAQAQAMTGLLVLDNCEHLLDACATVTGRLLAAAPELRVLATSREALGLLGEQVWPVRPLDVPDASLRDREQLTRVESVQLLLDRARAVRPDLDVGGDDVTWVVGICRALDGIPLAIELAAGRLRSLSLADLAERLDDQLPVLTSHRSAGRDGTRHQTLRLTLDWSYELLTDQQRTLAQRLSVFAGGFRLDAVETVCGNDLDVLDGIDELVAKSLVTFDTTTARYRLLEPIRQYLAERLAETGATEAVRRTHAEWVAGLAEAADGGLVADRDMLARRLQAEQSNVRAALVGALDRGDGVTALRIAGILGYPLFYIIGQADARVLLNRALVAAGPVDDRLRARGLLAAGIHAQNASEYHVAEPLLQEALGLFRACGSRRGQAWTLFRLAGGPATWDEDVARARFKEALALFCEAQDAPGIATALSSLVSLRIGGGDLKGARREAEEAVTAANEMGASRPMAEALRHLGMRAFEGADPPEARRPSEGATVISRSGGDWWQEAFVAGQADGIAAMMGDVSEALGHYARSVDVVDETRSPERLGVLLEGFVPFLWVLGRRHDAAEVLGAYDAIHSFYRNDFIREVARSVRASGLERARVRGARLSFDETIALVRSAIDDEQSRL
jgi:predicted ATPase/class 3 adenylate cyclase